MDSCLNFPNKGQDDFSLLSKDLSACKTYWVYKIEYTKWWAVHKGSPWTGFMKGPHPEGWAMFCSFFVYVPFVQIYFRISPSLVGRGKQASSNGNNNQQSTTTILLATDKPVNFFLVIEVFQMLQKAKTHSIPLGNHVTQQNRKSVGAN